MIERIVDANLNRLAEGLRVIEDFCRFGLDDAELSTRVKALRREAGRLRGLFPREILGARDSAGDVGRERVKEPFSREDEGAILGAAFGRAAESLRTIEEMAKLGPPEAAALAKSMRYRCYELEQAVRPRFDRVRQAARLRGLYLVLSAPAVGYEALAEAAVKAHVAAIQLRAKDLADAPLLALARRLRALTAGSSTLFFVNDRPDLARLCDADGLHLGQTDLSVADARRVVGPWMLIGKSTHNARQLAAALKERPDYVAIGPVFPTRSKAQPDPVLGLDRAARLLKRSATPAVAIGGIDADGLPALLAAGFRSYALIAHVGASTRLLAVIRRLQKLERQAGL